MGQAAKATRRSDGQTVRRSDGQTVRMVTIPTLMSNGCFWRAFHAQHFVASAWQGLSDGRSRSCALDAKRPSVGKKHEAVSLVNGY